MSKAPRAFTLVELLIAVAIVAVLAGICLNLAGHIHNKAARSRAQVELSALEIAMENYKTDNGTIPIFQNGLPDSNTDPGPNFALYKLLVPDDRAPYADFRLSQLQTSGSATNIVDPFGTYWGYYARPSGSNPSGVAGNEYSLWTTAGNPNNQPQWIKNW